MRIGIIGAGIAGLACADGLRKYGLNVTLFDKARGPGGRMSSRRIETTAGIVSFDHGAQYFTARDPLFQIHVDSWANQQLVTRWPEAGDDAWVGIPTMSTPIRHMAAQHQVHFQHHVHGLRRAADGWWMQLDNGSDGPFDIAIVALPAEQATAMLGLHDLAMASAAMSARSQPCWTAMIAFDGRLHIATDHLRDRGLISWAARNSAKPGRAGIEAWVVQANGSWSSSHLENEPESVAARLRDALVRLAPTHMPLPAVLSATAHRWRFAMARGTDKRALWNCDLGLGACGDWLMGPRVELAWLSGSKLADLVAASHPMKRLGKTNQ